MIAISLKSGTYTAHSYNVAKNEETGLFELWITMSNGKSKMIESGDADYIYGIKYNFDDSVAAGQLLVTI